MKLEWSQKVIKGKTQHFLHLNGVQAGFVFRDPHLSAMWRWHSDLDRSVGGEFGEKAAIDELEHRVRHRVKEMLSCLKKYGIQQEVGCEKTEEVQMPDSLHE